MEKKDIRDYIHLYLGCEVMTPDGVGWLASVTRDRRMIDGLLLENRVAVHFKTIRLTENSVDGFDKKRNYGHYLIQSESYVGINAPEGSAPEFEMPGGVKPILRKLSSMSEEEAVEVAKLSEWEPHFRSPKVERTKYNDLVVSWDGCFEGGEQQNVTGDCFYCSEQFLYLLSKSFDLFNLIESGLAIDASTIKP